MSSLAQQEICRQLVCVGEWWTASHFFLRGLNGDYFYLIAVGQVLLLYSGFERCHYFLVRSKVQTYIRNNCTIHVGRQRCNGWLAPKLQWLRSSISDECNWLGSNVQPLPYHGSERKSYGCCLGLPGETRGLRPTLCTIYLWLTSQK